MIPFVSLMILFPLVGAFCVAMCFAQTSNKKMHLALGWGGLLLGILSSALGLSTYFLLSTKEGTPIREVASWLGAYGIQYCVQVDGSNIAAVLLVSLLLPIVYLFEWQRSGEPKGKLGLILFAQFCFLGLICAQDLFMLLFFWSAVSIPLYFLSAIYGYEGRESASFRYLIVNAISSALFFVSVVLVYHLKSGEGFTLQDFGSAMLSQGEIQFWGMTLDMRLTAFFFFVASVCFRIAVWPIHGWSIEFMRQSCMTTQTLFTGVLLPASMVVLFKFGCSMFAIEMANYSWIWASIGAMNLLIPAILLTGQTELRGFLAYTSMIVSGILFYGLSTLHSSSVVGSLYHALAAGIGLGGFALFSGVIEKRIGHVSHLDHQGRALWGGLATSAPLLALFVAFLGCLLCGIPGLGGFIGQSLVLLGGLQERPYSVVVISAGVVLSVYGFFGIMKNFFSVDSANGPDKLDEIEDLTWPEWALFLPLILSAVWLGLYPKPILALIEPSVAMILSRLPQ